MCSRLSYDLKDLSARSLHLVLENGSTVFSIVSTLHAHAYYSTIHGHESATTRRNIFHDDIREKLTIYPRSSSIRQFFLLVSRICSA